MTTEDRDVELARLLRAAVTRPMPAVSVGAPVDYAAIDEQLRNAVALANVDELPPQRRLGSVKQAIMRAARLFLHRQAAFNRQTITLSRLISQQVASYVASTEQRLSTLSAAQVDLELRIEEHLEMGQRASIELAARLEEAVVHLREQLDELVDRVDELGGSRRADAIAELRADVDKRFARFDATVAALTSSIDTSTNDAQPRPDQGDCPVVAPTLPASVVGRIRATRYAQFEDRYRGSEEDIQRILVPYLDDVTARPDRSGDVLDIGCGRGEWLRLLSRHGISARGVDLNPETVDESVAAGLDVVLGDGIGYIAALEQGALGVLTAFHVLEHLEVEDQYRFFEAASRALRPGGLVIVETPNPTNLVVGAAAFYRDPTHLRPIHPDYLSFLASSCGFSDVEIRFLHPRPEYDELAEEPGSPLDRELRWAIYGPQDFALVARRPDHV